ncbi:MAG: alpha-D-ribose 1-methylphosphonate 5-triphosphate diphosphatase [Pseudomonadales bacterium]|jgi:alpha-D-ribose 1-methylphosphonate 5-triphosphate diphosphatase|nr:alpha-D-ribose 1-methylphosphonate 5-triphosphate diphosphatase [Pseudomonadales bacterium]
MQPEAQQAPAALRIVGARVVTADAVLEDVAVRIDDGCIIDLDGTAGAAEEIDFQGDLLIPGLVDIHTDNLERHYMPRPGAHWDAIGAAVAHDGQIAAAGITTVFDSLSLHGSAEGLDREEHLPDMIGGLDAAREQDLLRIDHLLHLRCEVSNPQLEAVLEPLLEHGFLRMLSVMDHTPGQGQYHDLEGFRARLLEEGKRAAEIEEILTRMTEMREAGGALERRRAVAAQAERLGVAFASHDDLHPEDIALAAELGCGIAEFPVSLEAAEAARSHGLINAMGAPNFVRGGSHSGNLSARETAERGLLDSICSDYVPMSMLRTVFMLTEAPFAWSLPEAVAVATRAPARMAKLDDRGEIAVGQRADVLRIHHEPGRWPGVRGVWSLGRRVA